eukprot:Gb_36665 [translate_table: standard]
MKSQRHQADHHKLTKLLSLIGEDNEEKKKSNKEKKKMKEWSSQAEVWKACNMKINPNGSTK